MTSRYASSGMQRTGDSASSAMLPSESAVSSRKTKPTANSPGFPTKLRVFGGNEKRGILVRFCEPFFGVGHLVADVAVGMAFVGVHQEAKLLDRGDRFLLNLFQKIEVVVQRPGGIANDSFERVEDVHDERGVVLRQLHAFRRGELPDGVVVARELPTHREGGILGKFANRFRVERPFNGGRDRAQAGVAAQSEAVDEALVGFGKIAERVGFEDARDIGGRHRQKEHFVGRAALGIQTKRSERDAAGSALRRHQTAATGTDEVGCKLSHTDLLSVDFRKTGGMARWEKELSMKSS